MTRVRFLSPASREVADATQTYLAESQEAANRFHDELERTVALIIANPHIGRPIKGDLRKVTLRRFPYYVLYRLVANEIVISVLAHHSRDPEYWADRL
ncbi:MAG TPA: type II toxin-antitoxin system RelE/ParE family toxin [Longimicrobium sp.]|nr:type II toxin-antitoxin system RelE/ParE family toxin [Longimicrobium sp.]